MAHVRAFEMGYNKRDFGQSTAWCAGYLVGKGMVLANNQFS